MTMVLGEDPHMVKDLKEAQRAMLAPLLHHYFNGCYAQLDWLVPQLGRIVCQVLFLLALAAAVIVLIVLTIRKTKRSKARTE